MNANRTPLIIATLAALTFTAGASAQPTPLTIAQSPLFVAAQVPPLNMLVVGKDHKNYYEAYNDASDLDGDGALDVRYKPATIEYFGYFNSFACYLWNAGQNRFEPVAAAPAKTCGGSAQWSGDFLNYLTTSRMDALRRVLYGGLRQQDTATDTTLQGAFFPQDAHSWGKEYQSIARDGYDIRQYAPLPLPSAGNYHLFAVTTVADNTAPLFRVLQNTSFRVWNWVSIEGPVANSDCFNTSNQRVSCLSGGAAAPSWATVPAAVLSNVKITTWRWNRPGSSSTARANAAQLGTFFTSFAIAERLCGSGPVGSGQINTSGEDNNPFTGTNGCRHDDYLTEIEATLTAADSGDYRFAVNGDDSVEVAVNGAVTVGRYGNNGAHGGSDADWNSSSGTVNLSAGRHTIRFRHVEDGDGDNWSLAWQPPGGAPATTRQDYAVRVQACPANAALRDVYCKAYPSGVFKPTGILHDYGETGRMKFGLITGSQRNNLEGGVLRRNVLPFASEINANTGQFLAGANGIVRNLDGLRMIGGGYNDSVTNNLARNENWNWKNGSFGNCPDIGERGLANRECRMWGNPVAEMLYESMRYYAGATVPTDRFANAPATSPGMLEEAAMGLTTETWRNPYAAAADGGLGYASCAKPYQTIISDINPSYDSDLPGSPFTGAVTAVNDTPPSVSSFNAATQGQTIWTHEFGAASRSVFVGQAGNAASDGAPTAKSASSLGNIRGLSPEEPTKEGTFFSASVAHFGRTRDLSAAAGDQRLSTFSIALASPLPRIDFPVNGRLVTILPFGKTVSGTFGGGARKPTNTIVDFYVEEIANLPGAPTNVALNGGRPYAAFRINYEDVEQGNDHDMDAIVRYEALANVGGTVTVNLRSEYAAGSANQNMGYVISGTTADGIYLEVRDSDSAAANSLYLLNTPPGAAAGQCAATGALLTPPCNQTLQLTSTRTFTPAPAGAVVTALQLKDPLWFAAKYGGFKEPLGGGNGLPDGTEWDAVGNNNRPDGIPDNYFLVTNPLLLRKQLSNAFDQILGEERPSGLPATTGARLIQGSLQLVPQYRVDGSERDWTGDLKALPINPDGSAGTELWSAASRLAAATPGGRKIFTASVTGNAATRRVVAFLPASFGTLAQPELQLGALGLTPGDVTAKYGAGINADAVFGYLRGVRSLEKTQTGGVFRNRSALLGSIVNSQPQSASKRDVFRWISQPELRADYQTFITSKRASAIPDMVYVGSNEGMLHGFNTATGDEVFAYIPASARLQMGQLPDPTFTHRFLVDGDVNVVDARIGTAWRSVLLGSTGRGGRTVFALDVTSPGSFADNNVLWELAGGTDATTQDRDVGIQLGKPQVMYGEDGGWYAVFANGVNSENANPVLMIVNLQTGIVAHRLTANDGIHSNGLTNIAMVDANGNGRIDSVYGGDLRGHVWKFDLSAPAPSGWGVAFSGNPLFTATDASGARQPITGGIDVARGAGGLMVYFGTGRYLAPQDASPGTTPQVQSLYAVLDRGIGGIQRSNLQAQQITGGTVASRETTRNPVNFNTQRGWYLDLAVAGAARGEMFFGEPEVRSGLVLFFSFEVTGDACAPGGKNWAYGLDAITGGALLGGTASVSGGTVGTTEQTAAIFAGSGAPIRGAVFVQPSPPCRPGIDPGCAVLGGPGSGGGPPPAGAQTRCGEVELNTKAVFERACGRQSWRQIR